MQLILGAAQLGLDYGISNVTGKPSMLQAMNLLGTAKKAGIDYIDTAMGYGDSQAVIGQYLLDNSNVFNVITKIGASEFQVVNNSLRESLAIMHLNQLYGCLVHDCDALFECSDRAVIINQLCQAKADGLVQKIGFSVYTAKQVDNILQYLIPDIIQVPVSLFDQRLVENGCLERLHSLGVEIHVRSVFLQGLVFFECEKLHPFFREIKPALVAIKTASEGFGVSIYKLAIDYVRTLSFVYGIVLGADTSKQVRQLAAALADPIIENIDYSEFSFKNEKILDPRRWPK